MRPDRFIKSINALRPGTTGKDITRLMALADRVQFPGPITQKKLKEKKGFFNSDLRNAFGIAADIYHARHIGYTDRYYCDPIRIYELLVKNDRADRATVLAAILHPVLRPETSAAQEPDYYQSIEPYLEKICKEFGNEVHGLVCNTLRVREINYLARTRNGGHAYMGRRLGQSEEETAKGFRAMLSEAVEDRRAGFIRLAVRQVALKDAFKNMPLELRLEEIFRNEKTYDPFAIGINARKELEAIRDFNLEHQQPEVYESIKREIEQAEHIVTLAGGKANIRTKDGLKAVALKLIEEDIRKAIPKEWREFCTIEWRIKKPSSIFHARQKKGAQMDVSDIIGFRVIVQAADEDFAVKNIYFRGLTKKLNPDPTRKLKNYIQTPKDNGFKALIHTFIFKGAELEGRFEIQVVGANMHRYNETTHESYKGATEAESGPGKTCTVHIPGGEVHTLPYGATSADLLAHLSPELAFSVNARSIKVLRANAFKPLHEGGNIIAQPLETGDYVQFQAAANMLSRPGNRQRLIRACRINSYHAKLARWNETHAL